LPSVAVVLLCHNSSPTITACIESVRAQTHAAIELLVLDNVSQDDSVQLAQAAIAGMPNATLVVNGQNNGFAAGMNQGARLVRSDYLLFLNADVFLAADYVEKALTALVGTEGLKTGVVGGRVLKWTGGQRTDELDAGPIKLQRIFFYGYPGDEDSRRFVFAPAGCCPLVRRAMLEDVKLANGDYYDGDYFMYAEDLDLWFRGHLRGWRSLYVPEAVAWHVGGGSFGGKRRSHQRPLYAQRWAIRNRWRTMAKDLPLGLFLYLSPWLLAGEVLRAGFLALTSPRSMTALWQALVDVLRELPAIRRKRRYIQSRRTESVWRLRTLFAESLDA
jgi:GT2 family glycosyltransferase